MSVSIVLFWSRSQGICSLKVIYFLVMRSSLLNRHCNAVCVICFVVLVGVSVFVARLHSHIVGVSGMTLMHDHDVDNCTLMIVQHRCTTCSGNMLCLRLLSTCLHAGVFSPAALTSSSSSSKSRVAPVTPCMLLSFSL